MGLSAPAAIQGGVDLSTPFACPATVSVRDAVYISGNNSVDKAVANVAGKFPSIGLVKSKPSETQAIVQYDGELDGFSGLVAKSIYYLSETLGQISNVAPESLGSVVQKMAVARNSTTIIIDVDRDYVGL